MRRFSLDRFSQFTRRSSITPSLLVNYCRRALFEGSDSEQATRDLCTCLLTLNILGLLSTSKHGLRPLVSLLRARESVVGVGMTLRSLTGCVMMLVIVLPPSRGNHGNFKSRKEAGTSEGSEVMRAAFEGSGW